MLTIHNDVQLDEMLFFSYHLFIRVLKFPLASQREKTSEVACCPAYHLFIKQSIPPPTYLLTPLTCFASLICYVFDISIVAEPDVLLF